MEWRNSLRGRMTATVTVTFAVWLLLICAGLLGYSYHTANQRATRILDGNVERVRNELSGHEREDAEGQPLTTTADKALPLINNLIAARRKFFTANHLVLFVVDTQQHIIARSPGELPHWPPLPDDHDWRLRTITAPTYTIVLGLDWEDTRDEIVRQALLLLALSLAVIVAVAVGAWIVVGRTLSPIGALSHQALDASTDSLHLRLHAPSDDAEIVELVGTLNDLLARLAETAAAKGRFYAAASHELRTPLQALSGHLEVALSRSRDAEAYRATLDEAYRQTQRLTSLVRDLLLLNQLDAATQPPPREPVCLAEICDRIIGHLRPLAEQRQITLCCDLQSEGELDAPPTHAEMLLRNVLENAVKYALTGGEVRITLADVANGVRLTVINPCSPIPDWTPTALFEPFFRLDASRNAKTGGNGLGLAICKAITERNGWEIALDYDGTAVTATVEIRR